jgi:hypothetical protein
MQTGERFVSMRAPQECENHVKNYKGEMKAEWKKSKCSAASSHPNKAILTIFSLVAEYFLQPPRTLYACYTPLSTLNSDLQCQEYFMNGYTAVQKRNEATDILKWHQAEFLSALFYCHPRPSEQSDPRTSRHRSTVTTFLHGHSKVTMGHVISLIYNHRQS